MVEHAQAAVLDGLDVVVGALPGQEGVLVDGLARPGHPDDLGAPARRGVHQLHRPGVHDEQLADRLARPVQQLPGGEGDRPGERAHGVLLVG